MSFGLEYLHRLSIATVRQICMKCGYDIKVKTWTGDRSDAIFIGVCAQYPNCRRTPNLELFTRCEDCGGDFTHNNHQYFCPNILVVIY